jgi:N-terminal domain of galactosyltransferase
VPWPRLKQLWKYVSSNRLAIRRESFLNLGGFRHLYTSYGFEDTDLGLRAWHLDLRFLRADQDIFHLAPFTREEALGPAQQTRKRLMRTTARKFFLFHHAFDSLEWTTWLIL